MAVAAPRQSCRTTGPPGWPRARSASRWPVSSPDPGAATCQLSSSLPNPATTSRSAESWAVIESRRRVRRSTSALSACELALGVGVTAVAQRVGLLLGRADDLLGLAARAADQLLGLLRGRPRGAAVAASVASRARCSAALERSSASVDEALGLRDGGVVVLGRLAGQALLLHGQGAAGLLHLALGLGAGLLGLARGAGAQGVGLLLGGEALLLGLALGGGEVVVGLGHRAGAVGLDVGHRAVAALLELAQLDDAHVLGVGLGLGLDRGGVALGLLTDLWRRGRWPPRSPRRPAPRPGAASRWPCRRARRRSGSRSRRPSVRSDSTSALERLQPALGLGEAGGEAGLLGGRRCAGACPRRRCRSRRDARSAATGAGPRRAGGGRAAAARRGRRLGALARRPAAPLGGCLLRARRLRGRRRLLAGAGLLGDLLGGLLPGGLLAPWTLDRGDHLGGLVPGVVGLVVKDGQALVAHASILYPVVVGSPTYAASVTHGRGVSHRDPCDAPRR